MICACHWQGVRGSVKRTAKGELSVYVRESKVLTKAMRPLPDKWAGLTDITKRYRQRHLDMIVNPSVRYDGMRISAAPSYRLPTPYT